MRLSVILLVGAGMSALAGLSIFFEPREPYPLEIFAATTLKGALVALITALSLRARSPWWHGLAYGALYGFAFAVVVFLAKGGFKSMDAPYVIPFSVVLGTLISRLVARFGFRRVQPGER